MLNKIKKSFDKNKKYVKKDFNFKGVLYKSTGELEIAKFLDKYEIDFEYESPIAVSESNKIKIWYPDFYLKEYQIVLEYFGMYNHNKAYKLNANFKKKTFQNCGIQFIPVYELRNKWEDYILKSMKMHQEMKLKKLYEVIEEFNKPKTNKFKILLKKIKFKEISKYFQ